MFYHTRPLRRFRSITLLALAATLPIALLGATSCFADTAVSPPDPAGSVGQVLFDKVQALAGTWDSASPTGVTTDVFRPFAAGTAVVNEEWFQGKQTQATVFYVVNGQLYADHYCNSKNQTFYTAVPSPDPAVFDFESRNATNVDVHPVHAGYARWRLVDPTHLVQDWYVVGGRKPVFLIHMVFVKRSARQSAAAAPARLQLTPLAQLLLPTIVS